MSRIHRDHGDEVHGPCERCGVAFTSATTTCRPMCPNCGHRTLSRPSPRRTAAGAGPEADGDEAPVEVRLATPRASPFEREDAPAWTRWRLN